MELEQLLAVFWVSVLLSEYSRKMPTQKDDSLKLLLAVLLVNVVPSELLTEIPQPALSLAVLLVSVAPSAWDTMIPIKVFPLAVLFLRMQLSPCISIPRSSFREALSGNAIILRSRTIFVSTITVVTYHIP